MSTDQTLNYQYNDKQYREVSSNRIKLITVMHTRIHCTHKISAARLAGQTRCAAALQR